jgi:Arc/MetJ-type ribon-helix-helix transcriptional regulator
MAREQLSITVPTDLAERAQALVAAGEAGSLSGYISRALAQRLDADERRIRSHALIDSIFGLTPDTDADAAAARAVAVIHAQAEVLRWVHDVTGAYPAPRSVSDAVAAAATLMRSTDDRDPVTVLRKVAVDSLAAHRASET